jgi:formamidopyrimidine-DNA glycosylase
MNQDLPGKEIDSHQLRDVEKMHKIGFLNKNLDDFDRLKGRKIEAVTSSGNVIKVKLDQGMNLLIAPEYGGRILYHSTKDNIPKYHLRVDFKDGTLLTTRLTSMGLIYAVTDEELVNLYIYKRDFTGALSPLSKEFTYEGFSELISTKNRMMKSLLVGKNAVLVGISNSAFQDIIYRAGIHPKRKGSDLSKEELSALYEAVKILMEQRLNQGGKDQFMDLYGMKGGYEPAMGPNMKGKNCPQCGAMIERIQHGGGNVYLCPKCQK